MKHAIVKVSLLLAIPLFMMSCDKDDDEATPAGKSRVLVVHASPDGPPVDVRVNNTLALSNFEYGSSSGYVEVNSGSTNLKVAPTSTTNNVIDANVDLVADQSYSVFAIDSVSKIKAAVVGDDLTPPASGKAHVRFFHFSPNAPAVDIAVTNGPVLFANRSFNDQSTTAANVNFTPVDAGTYDLEVRLAGSNDVVLSVPGVTLTAGKIYTVFAKGFVGGTAQQSLGAQVVANN